MPDKRKHRGQHPEDANHFATGKIPTLRSAVADFSLLLSKGYAQKSTLKLVGDRFALTERQRTALMRSACSDAQLKSRRNREVQFKDLANQKIMLDGYNLLITAEAALSDGVLLLGRDNCVRDLAGVHGSYRKVHETIPAIKLIAEALSEINIAGALWLFDSPVSNSGKLKTIIYELIEENNWPWDVELLGNPDKKLIETNIIIASSDSDVLDRCGRWTNLTRWVIQQKIPNAKIIDLSNL